MINIPNGKVTFLFTDIEGSTKLSQNFPEILSDILAKHNSILNEAVESHNGFVFKIIGDAFCCSFQNAEDAIKAAVDAQIKLHTEKWNDAVIKVRMGIHSGNTEWSGTDYMGYITLARANRVMSSAFGGQILMSDDSYRMTEGYINESISIRDLGERRLKDLIQPVKLFQIVSKYVPSDFPPLNTLDVRPNNLPVQLTSFIGREKDMQQVKDLLINTRLLTIIGSGGAGKTRLAMQAGADIIDDFANGVYIAEFAPVSDSSLIVQTLLNSLNQQEEPEKSPKEILKEYLKDKELLLILDNCEHLVHECAELSEMLLKSCAKLKIIATSREPLNCSGEQTFRIPSLSLPDISANNTPGQLTQYEAVRLFIERALAVNPDFRVNNENAPALAQICSQLDGIPLAIELAAVRIKMLSLNNIFERLENRFKLLTGGKRTALPRQQTLRAMIDWSYELLSEKEKILWSRLSVFIGGWTLESAEEICTDEKIISDDIFDLLNHLADKSIIIYDYEKDRYRILETIKQYGQEKLKDANETDGIFARHLNYYLSFLEKANLKLEGSESVSWLEKLESEHNNLQSAIEWSANGGDFEKGLQLSNLAGRFWIIRGHYTTGIKCIKKIIKKAQGVISDPLGSGYCNIGNLSLLLGEYNEAVKYFEESLSIFQTTGNRSDIFHSKNGLGTIAFYRSNFEQALKYYEECLEICRETENKKGISYSLNNIGNALLSLGYNSRAKKIYEESLELFRQSGLKSHIALSLHNLGLLECNLGNYNEAKKFCEEALSLNRERGDKRGIANTLHNSGLIAYYLGDIDQANDIYEECLSLYNSINDKSGKSYTINYMGNIEISRGNYKQAQKLFNESLAFFRELGDSRGITISLNNIGTSSLFYENDKKGIELIEESLTLNRDIKDKSGILNSLISLASTDLYYGKYEQAMNHLKESLAICIEIEETRCMAITKNRMGYAEYKLGNQSEADQYARESLKLSNRIGDKTGITASLICISAIFCDTGKQSAALTILGAAESALKSSGTVLEKIDQLLKEETLIKLQEKIKEQEYLKYYEEGKRMKLDEACQLAINN
ncbi:MAG: tetratricopeptide repeat protein [Ignavibacteria bacterium]